MNNSKSLVEDLEFKALDIMNKSGSLMTGATLGREFKDLDVMPNFGLWLT